MQRAASLALRIPAGLLPSTAPPPADAEASGGSSGGQLPPHEEASSSSSAASELRGLTLRPLSLFSRSASGPAARHAPPPTAALPRSATGLLPSAPPPSESAVASAGQQPTAQRMGSREPAANAPAIPAMAPAVAPEPGPASASPEAYSDDGFEADEADSYSGAASEQYTAAGSPGASSIGAASTAGASSSFGPQAAVAPHDAARGRPAHNRGASPSGRPLSRSSSVCGGGGSAPARLKPAPGTRPCSASPCKQPAR